jgi:hypothetical protein
MNWVRVRKSFVAGTLDVIFVGSLLLSTLLYSETDQVGEKQ